MAVDHLLADVLRSPESIPSPSPFLKWVGGKGKLLGQYKSHFPEEFNRYHEPFVGGGAVFFHLDPGEARLTDVNARLIETYRVIRDDVGGLLERLDHHREQHDAAYYYRQRKRLNAPRGLSAADRAALFIYLNKTCFNGLYRENRRGEFNVPVGRYTNPSVFDVPNLVAASRALQDVELDVAPFTGVLDHAEEGDFVYFDPPYVPVSATSNFTGYAAGGFDEALQIRLAQTFAKLARRGCRVMLSNSDCAFVRELYAGWRIERVLAPRSINSKSSKRGAVGEVAVMSW